MTGSWEPEVDDITAMRRENGGRDLRDFMRRQIADGKARRQETAKAEPPRPPGHRPGTWPTGSSPPGPPPELPASAWEVALEDYRTWLAAGCRRDRVGPLCECRPCQTSQDPRSRS